MPIKWFFCKDCCQEYSKVYEERTLHGYHPLCIYCGSRRTKLLDKKFKKVKIQ